MATYPRLLGNVHVIERPDQTLLVTRQGRFRAPQDLYAALPRLAQDMDGHHAVPDPITTPTYTATSTGHCSSLDQPSTREPTSAPPPDTASTMIAALTYLTRIGAARMEQRPRPRNVPDQLLALADADLTQEDPYEICGRLINTGAIVTGPAEWVHPIAGVLQSLSIPVTPDPAPASHVRLQLGTTLLHLDTDSGWLDPTVTPTERSVMAAALSAELIRRYLCLPSSELPAPGGLTGLERNGPPAHPAGLGGPEWPSSHQLRALVEDPASHLPTGPTGYDKPAMIRPITGPATAVPPPVAALLSPIHTPLRWERGDKAHQGAMAHRGIPSARCLYPTELYLWGADGLFYIEPGLDAMRPIHASPTAPDGRPQLVMTTRQGKTAYRYQTYSTLLCAQEAALTLATLDTIAAAIGARVAITPALSARGGSGQLKGAFEADERVVATIHLDDLTSLDQQAINEQITLATRRTGGHDIFNSLGLAPHKAEDILHTLAGTAAPGTAVYAVVHHKIGEFAPGVYHCTDDGVARVPFPGNATKTLQRPQDAKGWLAPDYGSSFLTVLAIATNPAAATADLTSLHQALREAATPIHHATTQATHLGYASRIYNGTPLAAITQLTGRDNILPLYQLMIGAIRPDGTLVCPLGR